MAYRLIDFSKAEKENVEVMVRHLDELSETGEEWLFRNVEMPPGATPAVADVVFFKCRDWYCITTRPSVTYRGENLSCRQLFAQSCEGFKTAAELYRFFRYLAHPPKELPEREAEKIVDLDRVKASGFCLENAKLLAIAIRKIAFEYGLVVDRIDAEVIIAILEAMEEGIITEIPVRISQIFRPFFFRNQQIYPGDCPLKLAGTSLSDLYLFPFGKILPLQY